MQFLLTRFICLGVHRHVEVQQSSFEIEQKNPPPHDHHQPTGQCIDTQICDIPKRMSWLDF